MVVPGSPGSGVDIAVERKLVEGELESGKAMLLIPTEDMIVGSPRLLFSSWISYLAEDMSDSISSTWPLGRYWHIHPMIFSILFPKSLANS